VRGGFARIPNVRIGAYGIEEAVMFRHMTRNMGARRIGTIQHGGRCGGRRPALDALAAGEATRITSREKPRPMLRTSWVFSDDELDATRAPIWRSAIGTGPVRVGNRLAFRLSIRARRARGARSILYD